MIELKDSTIGFNSNHSSNESIGKELNDIKMILLSIAMKLDEPERNQLATELSEIDSPAIKQWVHNLKTTTER
jgi:hypothetical protein